MKRIPKLFGIVYDLLLSVYFGVAVLWMTFVVGVPYGTLTLLLLFFPALVVIFFISIFIHEFGHLIGAFATGLKITLFASWPLMVVRSGKGTQLRHFSLPPPMLGAVAASPRNVKHLAWKRALYLCTGPMANLLVAIGGLNLAYTVNESHYDIGNRASIPFWNRLVTPHNPAAILPHSFALVNLFFFMASLRPLPIKKFYPDGAALFTMISNSRVILQTWLLETLTIASINGVRPGQINEEFIHRILVNRDGSAQDAPANFFGFYYYLDKSQVDPAGELIDLLAANQEKFDPRHRSYAVLETAYFEARHRHNAVAARQWLDQAPKDGVEPQTYLRAEAAVLLAEGHYKEAAIIAKAGLVVLPKSTDRGGAIAEKDWLEAILAECLSH